MSAVCIFLGTVVFLGAVYVFFRWNKPKRVPTIGEKWWGPGRAQEEDTSVKPFKIEVSDEIIKDLHYRLNNALPFQAPLEGVNQNYGINTQLLETIVDYWKTKYNWIQRQEFLNQFTQFKTNIQGLNIHFLHAKPKNVPEGVKVLPLVLVHGWPGSVREFYEIIPILTTPRRGYNFVFEVVAPSLPGYGFSDGAVRPGLGPAHIGQLFHKLMIRLNFDKYYVQGGDWGSTVVQAMAVLYPSNIIGIHRNFGPSVSPLHPKYLIGAYFPSLFFTPKEIEKNFPRFKKLSGLLLESGYFHIQATKPDTVGVALRESPVGLAAYIIEKFIAWTNLSWKDLPDGGLTKRFTLDQLLDNVMIYWVTRSITTSIRLYSEAFSSEYRSLGFDRLPVTVPAGISRSEHELLYPPETLIRSITPKLVHLTDLDDVGHFAAFERPETLAKDVFEFVEKVRNLITKNKEL